MADTKQYPHEHSDWRGYTLDELRFQRAVNLARLEIQKERLAAHIHGVQSSSGLSGANGWLGRIFNSFSYFEYGILAFRLVKRAISTIRKIRK